jgi:hypothetical protein
MSASTAQYRTCGVWLFLALLLLASAERRLADLDFNGRVAGAGLERSDLDGDEIRDRLKACNDGQLPAPPHGSDAVTSGASPSSTPRFDSTPHGPLPPRGPPAPASSAA